MRQNGKCHTKEEAGFLRRSGRAFVGQAMHQIKGNYKVRRATIATIPLVVRCERDDRLTMFN